MKGNEYLIRGKITSSLVRFAIPIILANVLQIAYSATDLLIIGKYATTADMSGVAVGAQVMLMITVGITGITTGLTVLLGRFSGAGNEKDVRKTIGSAIVFYAALSAVIMVLLVGLHGVTVRLMNTPPEAVVPARQYLLITGLGTVFIVGYNVTAGILRGLGNSKTPLIFVGIAFVITIILDLIFIPGLGLGAAGAALATVIAQGSSLLFSLVYLKKKGIGVPFTRADIKIHREYVFKMLRIGLPISFQEVLISLSFIFIITVVNGMGVVASAAVGIVEKLIGFFMMPTMALSGAVATMSAHNIGAGYPDRARKCLWVGVSISAALAVVLFTLSWFKGSLLTGIFSSDPLVVAEGARYLKTYAIDCVLVSVVFNLNGYFASWNKSVFSMIHSILTTVLIRVPFVVVVGGMAGVTLMTIGLAAPLSSLGSLIMCVIYYIWLSRRITAGDRMPAPVE